VPTFVLTINGRSRRVTADPEMPLLWVLRDLLRMTGTKYGCGVGVCGACTVHENNAAVRSCQIPLSKAAGKSYTTIEGLSPDGGHPCHKPATFKHPVWSFAADLRMLAFALSGRLTAELQKAGVAQ